MYASLRADLFIILPSIIKIFLTVAELCSRNELLKPARPTNRPSTFIILITTVFLRKTWLIKAMNGHKIPKMTNELFQHITVEESTSTQWIKTAPFLKGFCLPEWQAKSQRSCLLLKIHVWRKCMATCSFTLILKGVPVCKFTL